MKTLLLTLGLVSLAPAALAKDTHFKVVQAKSSVGWFGSKVVGGSHSGKINVKSGTATLDGDKLQSGEILVDMTSLTNDDLTDKSLNEKLVGHLKSPDFFDVTKHPTAKLVVDKAELVKPGEYKVTGTFSIKEKTKPVTFTVTESKAGENRIAKAEVKLDRTDFDVRYGSGKFFQNLGDKMIADEIKLNVELTLEPDTAKSASK